MKLFILLSCITAFNTVASLPLFSSQDSSNDNPMTVPRAISTSSVADLGGTIFVRAEDSGTRKNTERDDIPIASSSTGEGISSSIVQLGKRDDLEYKPVMKAWDTAHRAKGEVVLRTLEIDYENGRSTLSYWILGPDEPSWLEPGSDSKLGSYLNQKLRKGGKYLQQRKYYKDLGKGNFRLFATIAKGQEGYDGALEHWKQVFDAAKEYFDGFQEPLHSKMDIQEALKKNLF